MPKQYTRRSVDRVIGPSIAYVPLTKGYYALIDSWRADFVETWNWYYSDGRACRTPCVSEKGRSMKLHAALFPCSAAGQYRDHINGNSLDNRAANIRICTHQQNLFNTKRRTDNSTGYKGVSKISGSAKFAAHIRINGKTRYIGTYITAQDAHKAYAKEAVRLFGEYSRLL
jgi:hypothetical protein